MKQLTAARKAAELAYERESRTCTCHGFVFRTEAGLAGHYKYGFSPPYTGTLLNPMWQRPDRQTVKPSDLKSEGAGSTPARGTN